MGKGTDRASARRYSAERAGVRSAAFARNRMARFVRAKWIPLTVTTLGMLALAPILWLSLSGHSDLRGFVVGFYVATCLAITYHWCSIASGAALSSMGQAGEEWTEMELARLDGWRVVSALDVGRGDIDHIAIGPPGVLVVESKWTGSDLDLGRPSQWRDRGVQQAALGTHKVRGLLGWRARMERPVAGLVVYWGAGVVPASEPVELDWHSSSVCVVSGRNLRDLLGTLNESRITREEIDDIHGKIVREIDRYAKQGVVLPPSNADIALGWYQRGVALLVGFFVSAVALQLPLGWFVVGQVALIALGLASRRSTQLRPMSVPWIVGTQVVTVLAFGSVAVAALPA